MAYGALSMPRRHNLPLRLLAALVAAGCIALLATAAMLEPDPAGRGTHTQLGMGGCRWLSERGYDCPTCGMTTAFALSADGRLTTAFAIQPAGAIAALLTAMVTWIAAYTTLTGQNVARYLAPLWNWRTIALAVGLTMAAWAYRVAVA